MKKLEDLDLLPDLDFDPSRVIHVEPINDVLPHNTDCINCLCHPRFEIQEHGFTILLMLENLEMNRLLRIDFTDV